MTTDAPAAASAQRGRPMSAELDEAILDAACTVLASQGYRGFSLDAVAKAAGTTRPAIYRRWEKREDILFAALDHVMKVGSTDPATFRDLADLSDAALGGLLRDMVRGFAAIVGDPKASAVSISVSAAMYGDAQLRAVAHAHHYDRRKPLEAVMDAAQRRGLIRRDVPLGDLIHMLVGAIQYRSNMLQEPLTDAYVDNVIRLLIAGGRALPFEIDRQLSSK